MDVVILVLFQSNSCVFFPFYFRYDHCSIEEDTMVFLPRKIDVYCADRSLNLSAIKRVDQVRKIKIYLSLKNPLGASTFLP